MFMSFLKRISASPIHNPDIVETPCKCLGTRISESMYHGVEPGSSTLVSCAFDDDDSWDVDPACDMSTDRFDLDVKTPVPVSTSPVSE